MRFVFVASAIAAISLAGCGKKEEESAKSSIMVTQGGLAARSKDGGMVTVTDGTAANTKIPAFAPLYPGARIDTAMSKVGNDKAQGGTIIFKVDATPEKVVAFYKDKTAAGGFAQEMDSNMGAAHMFAAKSVERGEAVQVIASPLDKGSSVQMIWAIEQR